MCKKIVKVLFITNIPSPYRVAFFNQFGKLCDLTVIFERTSSSERDKTWAHFSCESFKPIVLNGLKIRADSSISFKIKKYLRDSYDFIICSNISSPTGMIAMKYLIKRRIPYSIEADGGFHKSGKGIKERIKKYFISHASYFFSSCKSLDEYFKFYGADADRIFRYPFTSLNKSDIRFSIANRQEKALYRKNNGIFNDKMILSVGQFIYRKGFDVLIEAAASFRNVGFYIVGGNPTEQYLSLISKYHLSNVHFLNFLNKKTLMEYYRASDLFVLPTREDIWGLVINEAMANGLPIISTDTCGAALEIVENNKNGVIVHPNSVEELIDAIKSLIFNPDKIDCFGTRSLQIINEYTIEKMAQRHIEIINDILGSK